MGPPVYIIRTMLETLYHSRASAVADQHVALVRISGACLVGNRRIRSKAELQECRNNPKAGQFWNNMLYQHWSHRFLHGLLRLRFLVRQL